ncbi:hypothetical protein ACFRAQ_04015 [Nocardia sp. NPDC056611]
MSAPASPSGGIAVDELYRRLLVVHSQLAAELMLAAAALTAEGRRPDLR